MEKNTSKKFKKLIFKKTSFDIMEKESRKFHDKMLLRRSVREFSRKKVPIGLLQDAIKVANSAPSGANKQPWHFTIVKNNLLKEKIRKAAEAEEKLFYKDRAPGYWLQDLKKFKTTWNKPFLEEAPFLIVVFKKRYDLVKDNKSKNYYVNESVGIASGFLLSALHCAGLVTLTHTPSPMGFLERLLERPKNEKASLLIPVGFPSKKAEIPELKKKSFHEICNIL